MITLAPFTSTEATKRFNVEANLSKQSEKLLRVEFNIEGPTDLIRWPMLSDRSPQRKDELWKTTCLEVFISCGKENFGTYHEFNCATNGDWNAYDFSSYRQGMTASPNLSVAVKQIQSTRMHRTFAIEIDGISTHEIKAYNLTMVMEFTNQEKSYWAAQHPLANADFHNKEVWCTL